ncbi:MAG: Gfo/Idh/MocA family oxidoreductase [Polyangiaceae bacterium]|nr:Gfo/Idh/MocA family oxidoreductase [Polyangiaceae bacterium]
MTRVAVIGLGRWGPNLARNFALQGALAGLCDERPEALMRSAEKYPDAKRYDRLDSVLTDPEIDAVAIATPASTHFAVGSAVLAAGKHALIEKPMANNAGDAATLTERARAGGLTLMVGHLLQYHPAVRRLQELVQDGSLGRMRYVYSNRLNLGAIRTEENILWSFAPHDVSVLLSLLETAPERVSCHGGTYLSAGVPDVTLNAIEFPDGVRAHLFVSWLHPFKEQRLVVVGSTAMAVFDDTADDKLLLYPHEVDLSGEMPTTVRADAKVIELPDDEPLALECAHFLECIRAKKTPRTDGNEAQRVLRVLDGCQLSMDRSGAPVDLGHESSAN